MADSEGFAKLVGQLQHEQRSVECKESCPWEKLKHKIAKTAMGMANSRDGGAIIIGVAKTDNRLVPEGMSEKHRATYDPDEIQAFVNRYADPYVRLDVTDEGFEGMGFLQIFVHEFEDVPVVCKRSSGDELQQGAIYVRSYRIAETCKIQSQTEMRELIDMATEKGIRRFLERMQRAGIPLGQEMYADPFEVQLEGL